MKRKLGKTDIQVTAVAMGCWPIAGMTSVDVVKEESQKTLEAAFECGINFFDTAFCYGADGISEKLLGQTALARREEFVIATKCGIHWDENVEKVIDGSPERLRKECDESLSRLQTDYVDLMYLHRPDPNISISESAGAILEMQKTGRTRAAGLSNCTLGQAQQFHETCPLSAIQLPYNMIEREIENEFVPWCTENQISLCIYWPLMKGLLAGKIRRDFQFAADDNRLTYGQFIGGEFERNQQLLDELQTIADETQRTIAELVIHWTINQSGITAALCGAKRHWQIRETASTISAPLSSQVLHRIEQARVRWADRKSAS